MQKKLIFLLRTVNCIFSNSSSWQTLSPQSIYSDRGIAISVRPRALKCLRARAHAVPCPQKGAKPARAAGVIYLISLERQKCTIGSRRGYAASSCNSRRRILRSARNPADYAVEPRFNGSNDSTDGCLVYARKQSTPRGPSAPPVRSAPGKLARRGDEAGEYALPALMRAEINASWCATIAPTKASRRRQWRRRRRGRARRFSEAIGRWKRDPLTRWLHVDFPLIVQKFHRLFNGQKQ